MFVYGNDADGNPCNFDDLIDLDDLGNKIYQYEVASGIKLRISKSNINVGSRLYTCVSHKDCVFRARFGPTRGNKKLVLKPHHNLNHCGIDRNGKYENGRKFKTQLQFSIGDSVDKIKEVKHAKPVPRDVMKAVRTIKGKTTTYNQGHQVLAKRDLLDKVNSNKSYELIIPYLEQFQKKIQIQLQFTN
jgi:hypothetical protein